MIAVETDVRAFLGTVAVRVHDEGNTIVVRGESGARDLPVPDVEPRDAFGGFELRLDSRELLRAVTTRTTRTTRTTTVAGSPVSHESPVSPESPVLLSGEPAVFSSSVATDGAGRLVHVLAEHGQRVLGMTSSLDALDSLLLGSPRARTTVFDRSELAEGGSVRTVWDADGPTVVPAGDFLRWRGRLFSTPDRDDRRIGSMPSPPASSAGRANLLLASPVDFTAVLHRDVRHVEQNVISVPRHECSDPVSLRSTALWNGRLVGFARSYLVWRDRGRAVITGTGARPDSRSISAPPLQVLPPIGERWSASVAVTDLAEVTVVRDS